MADSDIAVNAQLWGVDVSYRQRQKHQVLRVRLDEKINSRSAVSVADLEKEMSGTVPRFEAPELDVDQPGGNEGKVVVVGELLFTIPSDLEQAPKGDQVLELPKHAHRVLQGTTTPGCLVVCKLSHDKRINLYALGGNPPGLRHIRPLQRHSDKNIAWYSEWWNGVAQTNAKTRVQNIKANIAQFRDGFNQSRAPPAPALRLGVDEALVAEAKRDKEKVVHSAAKDPVSLAEGTQRQHGDGRALLSDTFSRADLIAVLEAGNKHRSVLIDALQHNKEKDTKSFPGGVPKATTGREFTIEFVYNRVLDAVASGDKNEAEHACHNFMKVALARAFAYVDDSKEGMLAHTQHDELLITHLKATD